MIPIIYKDGDRVPTITSDCYRQLLTTDEIKTIAEKHGFNVHTLLNAIYQKTKINSRNAKMVNAMHQFAVNKLEQLRLELQQSVIKNRMMSPTSTDS